MGEQVRDFILALLSGRGDDPMTITQLEAEYKDLEGTFIPAEELGYPNTEALLRSMKNVQLTRSGERIFVKVINCAHAQHVIELINGQKKDTVKQSPWTIPQTIEDNILSIIAVSPGQQLLLAQLSPQYSHFFNTKLPAPRGATLAWLMTANRFITTNPSGKSAVLQPMKDIDMNPYIKRGQYLRAQATLRTRNHGFPSAGPLQPQPTQRGKLPKTAKASKPRVREEKPPKTLEIDLIENLISSLDSKAAMEAIIAKIKEKQSPKKPFGSSSTLNENSVRPRTSPTVQVEPLLYGASSQSSPKGKSKKSPSVSKSPMKTSPKGPKKASPTRVSTVSASTSGVTFSSVRDMLEKAASSQSNENLRTSQTTTRNPTSIKDKAIEISPRSSLTKELSPSTSEEVSPSENGCAKRNTTVVVNTIRRQVIDALSANRRLLDREQEADEKSTQKVPLGEATVPQTGQCGSTQTSSQKVEPPEWIVQLATRPKSSCSSATSVAGTDPLPEVSVDSQTVSTVPSKSPFAFKPGNGLSTIPTGPPPTELIPRMEQLSTNSSSIHPLKATIPSVYAALNIPSLNTAKSEMKQSVDIKPFTIHHYPNGSGQEMNSDLEQAASLVEELHEILENSLDEEISINGDDDDDDIDDGLETPPWTDKPVEELFGLPLEKFLNLITLIHDYPPVSEHFLCGNYYSTYKEELVDSSQKLPELIQSLVKADIFEEIENTYGMEITARRLRAPIGDWFRKQGSSRVPNMETRGRIHGYNGGIFHLLPVRKTVNISTLEPAGEHITPGKAYLSLKDGKQEVLIAKKCSSTPGPTGCYWSMQEETGAGHIVNQRFLYKLDGTGIKAPVPSLSLWPAGRKPANNEIVTLKILKRLPNGVAVCCFKDEELFCTYSINKENFNQAMISVLRWGGLTYLLSSCLQSLKIRTAPEIPMQCMKYSDALVEFLALQKVPATSSFVSIIDVVELLAQRGAPLDLIEDLIRI